MTSTCFTVPVRRSPSARVSPKRKPAQAAEMSKAGQWPAPIFC